jgi:hypothetical protein
MYWSNTWDRFVSQASVSMGRGGSDARLTLLPRRGLRPVRWSKLGELTPGPNGNEALPG